jgi:hypothetical protein
METGITYCVCLTTVKNSVFKVAWLRTVVVQISVRLDKVLYTQNIRAELYIYF